MGTVAKFIFLFCLLITGNASGQTLLDIRDSFHQAVEEVGETRSFHELVYNIEARTPIITAYRAASEAMLARVMWNPLSKLGQVRKYAKLIEEAVQEDKENIEIRFLRLSIEYNLPRFLGMSSHLEDDTLMIVENLSHVPNMNIDPAHGAYILSFLKISGLCSEEQIRAMESTVSLL